MPNVMTALTIIGGALCESSVIAFLVPRRKVWMTPAAGVLCSNAANIRDRKTWTYFFALAKILSGDKSCQKCIYSVAAQGTAEHSANFGRLLSSDVDAVTKARRKTRC